MATIPQINYGIPAMDYGPLTESLANLGRGVGMALTMKAQQKQAAEQLPFITEQLQLATKEASAGRFGDAYSKIIGLSADPSLAQNPFISNALNLGMQGIDAASKQAWFNVQRGGGGGGGGGGTTTGGGTSLLEMFSGGTGGGIDANVGGMADFIDQEAADQLPKGEASAGTTGNWSFQAGAYERPTKEIETTANQEFEKYSSGDVTKQESYRTSVMSPQTPRGTEFVEQPGLNRFKGFERVTGVFVPLEKTIDFPEYSVRKGETGAISENIKFGKKTINEKQKVKAEELAYNDLPTAIARISQNQSLEKYFLENSPESLDIGSKKDQSGQQSFFIGVRGQKDSYMPIEQDDYLAATIIRKLPSSSKTLGAPLAITAIEEPQAVAPSGAATERFPVRQTGAQMQAGIPAAQPPTAAPAAPQFSADNPFSKQVRPEQAAPTGRTLEASRARGLATRQATAKRELESVSAQIKDIENMKVGRRNATAAEKATRWEELNAEKKRLEGILAQ
jgi:hypothetical protein